MPTEIPSCGQPGDSVSHRVIDAVAEASDVDPTELEPLYDVVDPDALDNLFRPTAQRGHRRGDGKVTFTYNDHWVTVKRSGVIDVSPI